MNKLLVIGTLIGLGIGFMKFIKKEKKRKSDRICCKLSTIILA